MRRRGWKGGREGEGEREGGCVVGEREGVGDGRGRVRRRGWKGGREGGGEREGGRW